MLNIIPGYSQNQKKIDSLLDLVEKIENDTILINLFVELYSIYLVTNNDSALICAENIINLARITGDSNNLASGLVFKSDILQNDSEFDLSYELLMESLKIRTNLGEPEGLSKINMVIGSFYITWGMFYEHDSDLVRAEKFYNQSCVYMDKSFDYAKKTNNKHLLANVYYSLANAHQYNFEYSYEVSLKEYRKSKKLYTELGLTDCVINCMQAIGSIHYMTKQYDSAELVYKECIDLFIKNKNIGGLEVCYYNLALLYSELSRHEEAIFYNKKCDSLCDITGNIAHKLIVNNSLYIEYRSLKMYKEALQYYTKYVKIRTQLLNETTNTRISELEIEHQTREKEKENRILQANNRNLILILSCSCLVLIVIVIFFILYRQRQKTKQVIQDQNIKDILKEQELKSINALMEGQEIERKRIAEDLHDRLGSMLSTIKLYFNSFENKIVEFQTGGNSQYLKAKKILDDAVLEVRKISHNITSSVLMKFGLVAALRDLGDTLESTEQIKVNIIAFGVDERPENRVEIGLYRIAQELINNILKHANATKIIIRLTQKEDLLTMSIIDDGVGFDVEEVKKKNGMGLHNVSIRAKQINGTLKIISKKGKGCKTIINIILN